MKDVVGNLALLVTGERHKSSHPSWKPAAPKSGPCAGVPGKTPASAARQLPLPSGSPKVMKPNEVIPLDGDDFRDF